MMFLLFLLLPQAPLAQVQNDPQAQAIPEYQPTQPSESQAPSTLKVVSSLMFVIGLIAILGWAARRFLPQSFLPKKQAGHMQVLQNMPLGSGAFLSLVEAEGQKLLLGVSEKNISLISRLDPFQVDEDESIKTVEQLLEES